MHMTPQASAAAEPNLVLGRFDLPEGGPIQLRGLAVVSYYEWFVYASYLYVFVSLTRFE